MGIQEIERTNFVSDKKLSFSAIGRLRGLRRVIASELPEPATEIGAGQARKKKTSQARK